MPVCMASSVKRGREEGWRKGGGRVEEGWRKGGERVEETGRKEEGRRERKGGRGGGGLYYRLIDT